MAEQWAPTDGDNRAPASLDLAQRLISKALADARVDANQVLGVGVGIAVPIDPAGKAISPPSWHGLEPARELEARLGLPVQLDRDANTGALGEHLFGAGRGVREMLYLRLSAGIGLGLILHGRVYRGFSGIAGALGHIPVSEQGPICGCGNRGCLDTMASADAVADLLSRSRNSAVTVPSLLEMLDAGDRGARRAVADAGAVIGVQIATAVNILNPELVVIGGDFAQAGDVLVGPIRAAVEQRAVVPAARAARITHGTLGTRAGVMGAAALQLARAPHVLASRMSSTAARSVSM